MQLVTRSEISFSPSDPLQKLYFSSTGHSDYSRRSKLQDHPVSSSIGESAAKLQATQYLNQSTLKRRNKDRVISHILELSKDTSTSALHTHAFPSPVITAFCSCIMTQVVSNVYGIWTATSKFSAVITPEHFSCLVICIKQSVRAGLQSHQILARSLLISHY